MKKISNFTKMLLVVGLLLGLYAITIIVVDPLFHYHKPLNGIKYTGWGDSRYICDGFVKHFDYDTITTGDSLSANYKTSEINELFGFEAIKASYYYADYSEISDLLKTAIEYNEDFENVFWTLNPNNLLMDKDFKRNGIWPEYLYNKNPFDDVNYVLNKDVMWSGVIRSIVHSGDKSVTESFDFDGFLSYEGERGKEIVVAGRGAGEPQTGSALSEEEKRKLQDNLNDNIVQIVEEKPELNMNIIIPPLSIIWWNDAYRSGELEKYIEAEEETILYLLQNENIRVYSFVDEFDTVCDFDRYCDTIHYGEEVSSMMLKAISEGQHEITEESFEDYSQRIRDFYMNYKYDDIFLE